VSSAHWFLTASLAAALAATAPSPVAAGKANQPPDLSGQWRLDPSRSESPRGSGGRGSWRGRRGGGGGVPGGRGGFPGGRGGGGWGGGRGEDEARGPADSTRRTAARMTRLPDWIRVDETAGHVVFSDSTGAALLEVRTGGSADGAGHGGAAALQLEGKWNGDRLEVERTGPRGGKIVERYQIEDRGRTLVVETKIDSNGRRPSMSFKRVYSRVES
jgi:hypothetical protein